MGNGPGHRHGIMRVDVPMDTDHEFPSLSPPMTSSPSSSVAFGNDLRNSSRQQLNSYPSAISIKFPSGSDVT